MRLAQLGLHVTLLHDVDADAGFRYVPHGKQELRRELPKHGDAAQLANLLHGSFDLIVCHNILQYVDDPCAVLRSAACASPDPSSIISVLVRNQAGEVLKAARQDGDLAATERNLTAEWGHESLYGGRVRLFTAESLKPCC